MQAITYEQVRRFQDRCPDMVHILQLFEPQLAQMRRQGLQAEDVTCTPHAISFHWSRGN
jgi:hypothetical protein